MNLQQPLNDITKKFNPSLNVNALDNLKLRSKSTTFIKPKLYHQSSIDNIKKFDKGILTESKQSLLHHLSFERRSRHQISAEIPYKDEDDTASNLHDLYRAKIELNSFYETKNLSQETASNELSFNFQLVRQSIKDFVANENGLILLETEGKITFKNFLNKENQNLSDFVNEFFRAQNIKIDKVFSTSYSTFLIDQSGQTYASGLNDKGQLGLQSLGVLNKPEKVDLSFKTQISQKIIKICGGPFHTLLLTNFNKAYYTGALYSETQIANDSFLSKFTEITIRNEVIRDVQCGLTSCAFLTKNNKIFIMGLFGESNFYKSPTDIELPIKSNIKQIKISNDCIYTLTQAGLLFKVNMNKRIPIINEVKIEEFIANKSSFKKTSKLQVQSINSCLDKILIVGKFYQDSISNPTYKYFTEFRQKGENQTSFMHEINYKIGLVEPSEAFVVKNLLFVTFSSHKVTKKLIKNALTPIEKPQINIQTYMEKIKTLEQENMKLKELNEITKEKKSRSKITQKLPVSNINFNFQQEINPRTFTHDLEIQFSDIKLNKKIAQGGYGLIYKGEWKKTIVAVKIFKIDENNTNSIKQFISECRAMEALRHPNIVMFLGACLKPPNFAIVLEYCEGGTLWSLLQNHKIELSWKERINLALETAKAMNYLHDRKNPIVHRDLKSLNILLDQNRKVKLADFGWTKCLENYMTSKIGTYQWMAPEVLTGQQYTEKADVFSYSIILWEIAAREAPYRSKNIFNEDINGIQVAYDVANKEYRPAIPSNTPAQFKELTERCWEKSSEKRPSFIEIIENLQNQLKKMA